MLLNCSFLQQTPFDQFDTLFLFGLSEAVLGTDVSSKTILE